MSINTTIVLQISVPVGPVDEMIKFCSEFQDRAVQANLFDLNVTWSSPAQSGPGDDLARSAFTIDDQLDRFAGFWKSREANLRRIHSGLVDLGYVAHLPESRGSSAKPASYIRYVDPVGNITLGTTNSGSFLFVGELKETLRGNPVTEESRDGVRVQFDSDVKVDFILERAAQQKARAMS